MAYYSTLETEVYHTCRNCTRGNNIEAENLCKGQPLEARLCEECAGLADPSTSGICVSGTPTPAKQLQKSEPEMRSNPKVKSEPD